MSESSEARAALGGKELWCVSDRGKVEVKGDRPPEWAAIEKRLHDDEDAVDDAPQTLAEAICGFRVGESDLRFALLKGPGTVVAVRGSAREEALKAFLRRLFRPRQPNKA